MAGSGQWGELRDVMLSTGKQRQIAADGKRHPGVPGQAPPSLGPTLPTVV